MFLEKQSADADCKRYFASVNVYFESTVNLREGTTGVDVGV